MNFDDWEIYSQSFCPLQDCEWHLTWVKDLDRKWLEAQLLAHVSSHPVNFWVREVVQLQLELVTLQKQLDSLSPKENKDS